MIERYILSVPYDRNRIDFARRLEKTGGIKVSRKGPQRRVQISLDSTRVSDLRDLLPKNVRIEPVIRHKMLDSSVALTR